MSSKVIRVQTASTGASAEPVSLCDSGGRQYITIFPDATVSWNSRTFDQLTSASRTNGPNGAADAAYSYQYQYDLVGNHLREDRGTLELNGTFNPLNQLTYRDWSGKLTLLGNVDSTGAVVLVQGVTNAPPFYQETNWLGGATLNPGSNSIPIVINLGTNSTQLNRIVKMPPTNPQVLLWDKNGNLTNNSLRMLTWNEENRVTQIEATTEAIAMGLPKRKTNFVYDGMGRMVQRTDYSGWTGSDYATTNIVRYVRDGHRILAELDAQNNITAYHVWGLDLSQSLDGAGGIGGLLARVSGTNTWLYTFDGNGNVADVLDTNATAVAHYEYDPFGKVVA